MKKLKEFYTFKDYDDEGFLYETSKPNDYTDLFKILDESIVLVLTEECGHYQGDYYCLFLNKDTDEYGYLCFGYGSCSGCDAFQACNGESDYQELAERLASEIIWKNKQEMYGFLHDRDWEGQYNNPVQFVIKALDILR